MGLRLSSLKSLMAISWLLFTVTNATAATKPNILLVMVDDLGWTDIGSFGSEIGIPNLDVLTKEGVVKTVRVPKDEKKDKN